MPVYLLILANSTFECRRFEPFVGIIAQFPAFPASTLHASVAQSKNPANRHEPTLVRTKNHHCLNFVVKVKGETDKNIGIIGNDLENDVTEITF